VLRENSAIRTALGEEAFAFLEDASGAFQRLLPHTKISAWTENRRGKNPARWGSEERREINVCIDLTGVPSIGRAIHATVSRKTGVSGVAKVVRTLDLRELDLCRRIATRLAETLRKDDIRNTPEALTALRARFDEDVVAGHLEWHHDLRLDLRTIFEALRTLAGQTYENRSIALGVIVEAGDMAAAELSFPAAYFRFKKYKALTDGYRTGYVVSSTGRLIGLADLDRFNESRNTGSGMFPEWAENMARASTDGRCGICLTRSGDILVFGDGALRFVYRFGRWRYMNHAQIVDLLRSLARVQKVPPEVVGAVTRSVYRTALDISFRRSGGLIVVLRARKHLRELVRARDEIGSKDREPVDDALDAALPGQFIQGISRRVLVELASLDGALVIANSGKLLTYAAILQPKQQGRVGASEGSRTKAAIGASNYGLTVKISADGEIEVFSSGKSALRV
jgi:hypothetical protein